MSRGPGKVQRAALTVLEDSVVGGHVMPVTAQEIAGRIWDEPSRSQVGSVRRALNELENRGLVRSRWANRSLLWEAA
jgi:hypothetical protein